MLYRKIKSECSHPPIPRNIPKGSASKLTAEDSTPFGAPRDTNPSPLGRQATTLNGRLFRVMWYLRTKNHTGLIYPPMTNPSNKAIRRPLSIATQGSPLKSSPPVWGLLQPFLVFQLLNLISKIRFLLMRLKLTLRLVSSTPPS